MKHILRLQILNCDVIRELKARHDCCDKATEKLQLEVRIKMQTILLQTLDLR